MKTSVTFLILIILLGSGLPLRAETEIREWRFRVFLDDRKIGYHNFTVSEEGDLRRIRSEARFEVKFLFFSAYKYEHDNVELWDEGCLNRIVARTNDNGRKSVVLGSVEGGDFVLEDDAGDRTLPSCVKTFAYWDSGFMQADRLLNSQTGKYVPVEVTPMGDDFVVVDGMEIPARCFRLDIEGRRIDLWYSADGGEWLALETNAKGDRTIRYEPVSIGVVERLTGAEFRGAANET